MTDYTGIALVITATFSGLATLGAMVTAYMTAMSDKERRKEAKEQRKIAMETHAAVNGAMTLQLKMHAGTTTRLAELTGEAPDIAAAEAATKLLRDHEAQIALTNAQNEPVTEGDNPTR